MGVALIFAKRKNRGGGGGEDRPIFFWEVGWREMTESGVEPLRVALNSAKWTNRGVWWVGRPIILYAVGVAGDILFSVGLFFRSLFHSLFCLCFVHFWSCWVAIEGLF